MRRLTISIDDDLADTFDQLMKDKGYRSRSETFRDLLRGRTGQGQPRPKRALGIASTR
jgi:CopG family nickel-responsive transcriptional regulator